MAKITGPMHSDGATGKFADSMVFGTWKGKKYVRSLVKPSNPRSGSQGDQRLVMGGTGKAVAKVGVDSVYHTALKDLDVIPNDQSKQSYLVKRIIQVYLPNATDFETIVTEYEGHTAVADFQSAAIDAGFTDFTISYKATESDYVAGMQLYMLAKIGSFLGMTAAPFDTALASWTATEIDDLVTQLAAA